MDFKIYFSNSTFYFSVIPLEDLPELQVGFGFGVASKDKAKKPAYLKVSIAVLCGGGL